MKYRSEYPESYREGIVNKSFTISKAAQDLLTENDINPISAFVNDLIIDALQEKDYFKKKIVGQINQLAVEYKQKYGMNVNIQIGDDQQ